MRMSDIGIVKPVAIVLWVIGGLLAFWVGLHTHVSTIGNPDIAVFDCGVSIDHHGNGFAVFCGDY